MSKIKKRFKTFLTDGNGVSERDFLIIISAGIFFLFVAIGLIMVLFNQQIDSMYLSLLDMVAPVVMTITGGLFGVSIAETIANRPNKQQDINVDATIVPSENTIEEDDII